jgi:hypothetical protein
MDWKDYFEMLSADEDISQLDEDGIVGELSRKDIELDRLYGEKEFLSLSLDLEEGVGDESAEENEKEDDLRRENPVRVLQTLADLGRLVRLRADGLPPTIPSAFDEEEAQLVEQYEAEGEDYFAIPTKKRQRRICEMEKKTIALIKHIARALRDAERSGVENPIRVLEKAIETRETWERFKNRLFITKSTDNVK